MSKKITSVKKHIPKGIISTLGKIKNNLAISKMYNYEKRRYLNFYSKSYSFDLQNIKARLILHSHRLEKGLSHIEFREGFGKSPLEDLKLAMDQFNHFGHNQKEIEYELALSTLNAYYNKHLDCGIPEYFTELYRDYLNDIKNSKSSIGGIRKTRSKDKLNNRDVDYKTLFENRVSVREWDNKPVDLNLITEAIEISMKTPTVCNRQSPRIRVISNSELIEKTLKLQRGFSGYKLPPILTLITTDSRDFISVVERAQIYIDGGLFSMSFLNALEYVGLGACALNAMFRVEKEKKMREILNVPENENFIMFIVIGNFLEETPYCKSWRRKAEDISTFIT